MTFLSEEIDMKTKEEIKEEIIQLHGGCEALNEAMNVLHNQNMDKIKQIMSLSHMLREIKKDKGESE
jgi:hypothetical protein